MALERRFGQRGFTDQDRERLARHCCRAGESLGTFTADVQLYTQRGYLQFAAAAQEELAPHAFLQGLTPERLCQHVCLSMPQSFSGLSVRRNGLRWCSPHSRRPPIIGYMSGWLITTRKRTQKSPVEFRTHHGLSDSSHRRGDIHEPGQIARNYPVPPPKVSAPTASGK